MIMALNAAMTVHDRETAKLQAAQDWHSGLILTFAVGMQIQGPALVLKTQHHCTGPTSGQR